MRAQHRDGTNGAAASKLGAKHHNWKGGRIIDFKGYVRILMPEHPMAFRDGYVMEHVYIMCAAIGRPMYRNEVVHHKDENRANNAPENLLLMTRGEHTAYHKTLNRNRRREAEESGLSAC